MNGLEKRIACDWMLASCALALSGCAVQAGDDLEDGADKGDITLGTASQSLSFISDALWTPTPFGKTRLSVCFENGTAVERTIVQLTVQNSWEAIGSSSNYGVDFFGWGDCTDPPGADIPIEFVTEGTSHTTNIGRYIGGMKLLSVPGTWVSAETVMHEFGHALGFAHEWQRPDYPPPPPNQLCGTPTSTGVPDTSLIALDPQSIMNYRTCGRIGTLTPIDISSFMSLYGPASVAANTTVALRHDPSWAFVEGSTTPRAYSQRISSLNDLTLVKVSGSSGGGISSQDSVRIRTSTGRYLRANGAGSSFVVDTTTSTTASTIWRISNWWSGPIRVNDQIWFMSNDDRILGLDASKRLVTSASAPSLWRILMLPSVTHHL